LRLMHSVAALVPAVTEGVVGNFGTFRQIGPIGNIQRGEFIVLQSFSPS